MNKYKNRPIRTDLAIENSEHLTNNLDGVNVTASTHQKTPNEDDDYTKITVTKVEILNEQGSNKMGKPIGNYITLECLGIKENMLEIHNEISEILSNHLKNCLNEQEEFKQNPSILVIGLGNWNITPDALGPKVVSKTLVTRHIKNAIPKEFSGKLNSVSAISPGVMGITGMETVEIVKGLVDKTNPSIVICIDALASRKTSRINTTIQISDTGITPGSGIGNHRKSLNKETLGIPVIAIGVPTVVDAATLASDTIDKILNSMINEVEKTEYPNRIYKQDNEFYKMLKNLEEEEKYSVIKEILDPYEENMFVTPKEVDIIIERLSNIISDALNFAVHPKMTKEEISLYNL